MISAIIIIRFRIIFYHPHIQNYPELMEIRICLSMADLKPTKCLGLDQVYIGKACGGANDDPMIIYPPTNFT